MKEITKEYLLTALWSEVDDNGNPLDDNYSIEDFSKEAIEQAEKDVSEFTEKANNLFHKDDKDRNNGHDFWLTRNDHGAGFWDGDYVNGDELTEVAKSFKEIWVYIGDDNKLYFMN